MATAFTPTHIHTGLNSLPTQVKRERKASPRGPFVTFWNDLWEDVRQRPLQAAKFAKHDMFREHIHAMSISYFALILLLIVGSFSVLGFLVRLASQ